MYEVTVTVPGRPKGASVDVTGFGRFENGIARAVTDKEIRDFRNSHSRLWSRFEEDPGLDKVLENEKMFSVRRVGPSGAPVEGERPAPPERAAPPAPPGGAGNKKDEGSDT